MNSTPQLDLHPDADSLSAFVEQMLGAPEREQVLAHLAGCSRCRQVIYLAQQAAADADAPAAQPATQPVSWFWNWRFAWVPAAAVAAALALVVTFHPWHTTQMPEMAKAVPPRDEAAPQPLSQERTSAVTAHTAYSSASNVTLGAHHMPSQKVARESAPSAARPADFGEIAPAAGVGQSFMPSSNVSAPQPETPAQSQPETAVTAWQQERQQAATVNTLLDTQKSIRVEKYSARANRQAATAGPRMVQQSQSASGASFDIATQQQFAGLTASLKASQIKLPSGLATISRATAQNLTLEIDLAGSLFLSGDSGRHWEQVAQQWTGRAIEVRTKTNPNSNNTSATGFELKNDAGSTWASADGKTWTAQ